MAPLVSVADAFKTIVAGARYKEPLPGLVRVATGKLVEAAKTVMVPCILGLRICGVQWYGNTPASSKVWEKVSFISNKPESKPGETPSSVVTVCIMASIWVHFTISPAFTVRVLGVNVKFIMLTSHVFACVNDALMHP